MFLKALPVGEGVAGLGRDGHHAFLDHDDGAVGVADGFGANRGKVSSTSSSKGGEESGAAVDGRLPVEVKPRRF